MKDKDKLINLNTIIQNLKKGIMVDIEDEIDFNNMPIPIGYSPFLIEDIESFFTYLIREGVKCSEKDVWKLLKNMIYIYIISKEREE